MDPVACWKRVCDLLTEGRIGDAAWANDELMNWLRKGGYRPDDVPMLAELEGLSRALGMVIRALPT